jgi:TolB-like protein
MKFAFGDCVLDGNRRELTRGEHPVPVGPQVFDLLIVLVENRDRVVSRDDLLQAVWGGRIVSESTVTSHINAARKAIGDKGSAQRIIKTIPRKGFRFVADVRQLAASPADPLPNRRGDLPAPALPDKPSIAVLPFHNLSGDPDRDYFADGIVEDIITALSRIRWLFVIARNSSFTYKGRAADIKEVGHALGVRYVLEGSVRQSANRVRITGQLVDASNGINIWADRFEGDLDNIFDLQDEMTRNVVGAISPHLERAEIKRAERKRTESLDAYDYYLRGLAHVHRSSREAIGQALTLFERAVQLDSDYASAYALAAWCIYWRKMNGWLADPPRELAEGARLAAKALERGRDDAVALTRAGHALPHFGGDLDRGMAHVDRALMLNPNLAAAWYLSAFQRISCGEPDQAIERFAYAMRLSPLDPETFQMQTGTAMAHMFAGRFDAASAWAEKASNELPGILRVAVFSAASHALAGRTEEARQAMQHVRRLDPDLKIANLEPWVVLRRPEDLATLRCGMRKAGLPE